MVSLKKSFLGTVRIGKEDYMVSDKDRAKEKTEILCEGKKRWSTVKNKHSKRKKIKAEEECLQAAGEEEEWEDVRREDLGTEKPNP